MDFWLLYKTLSPSYLRINMTFNQAGLDLLKSFEGCKLVVYKDIIGILTVGYGHTGPDITAGSTWTQEQCDEALETDLLKFKNGVYDLLDVSLTDNQYSALVCFSYNVGLTDLKNSHLLKYVNSKDFNLASEEFKRWDRAGGVEVPGLLRRRLAERSLFLT